MKRKTQNKLAGNKIAQDFVIESLALGKSGQDILEGLKAEFDITVTEAGISWYRVHRRPDVLTTRLELEKQILDKFPLALVSQRMNELQKEYKEADKIGRFDEDQAMQMLEGLEGKNRKEAVLGMYHIMQDGRDRRINRKQSILKQIADEVRPVLSSGGGKEEDDSKAELKAYQLALRGATDAELKELDAIQERLIKKHAKAS